MKEFDWQQVVSKYLSGSISSNELDAFDTWLKIKGNELHFRSYIRIDFITRHIMSQYDSERAKTRLMARIHKDKSAYHRLKIKMVFQYAAVGLLLLSLGYSYHFLTDKPDPTTVIPKNAITLQLSDGMLKTISEEESTSILNGEGQRIGLQKGNQLIYHSAMTVGKLAYNTLRVPYGKRFTVILSDGTKAFLNAGTSLKYPVEFVKGENRQVYLIGEGYFDVAEDKLHPFIVHIDDINVKVLGTEFNVSAYSGDATIKTVLVEGAVELVRRDTPADAKNGYRMQPGLMATWERNGKKVEFKEVDTQWYTGWKDGKIIFKHSRFDEILKTLERNYDVSIINTYSQMDTLRFTASFDTETIEQVLEAFSKNHPMLYAIKNDKIQITKP